MDPNEALRQIRLLIKQMEVEDKPDHYHGGGQQWKQHAEDLAEQVQALDEWLAKGGFPPDAWANKVTIT